MATIGRGSGCGQPWPTQTAAFWLGVVCFVHLMYIVEFEKRLLVLFQWAWNYFTWNRSAG